MHIDENPVAAGHYDDTWRDPPDAEVRCPHCKAMWGLNTLPPDNVCNWTLYAWKTQDGKHECSTRDSNKIPVTKDFCFACAYETATFEDLKDYIDDTQLGASDLREWRIGF